MIDIFDYFAGSFVILCFSVMLFLFIDETCFGESITTHIFTKSDCTYIVPDNWDIVTDGKRFAIKYLDGNMYITRTFHHTNLEVSRKPLLFVSENKAKGFLKRYLYNPMEKFK